MNFYAKQSLRATSYFLITIITGLAVYQSPPVSLEEFWQWAWQPGLQGLLAALTSLGVNHVTSSNGQPT